MLVAGFAFSALAAIVSFVATALVLRQARQSSTIGAAGSPLAGGLGIALGGVLVTLFVAYHAPWPAALVLLVSLFAAGFGYLADRRALGRPWRLGVTALLLALLIGLGIPLFLLRTETGIALPAPVLLGIVVIGALGWISAFARMDRIAGLAASQAALMLSAAAALALFSGRASLDQPGLWWMVGLAAASGGFLVLAWPPARLAMGRLGTSYLGLMLVFLALNGIVLGWFDPQQALVLGAVPIALATADLLPVQRAAPAILRTDKRRMTAWFLASLLVLLPLAGLAGLGGPWTFLAPALALLATLALALWMGRPPAAPQ
ncbi:hypothetical protein EMQ25_10320 [Arsenicitalea aurantiaca]|uniref:Uncharacterized protein n=1 Tax=Arsenicitalea aurantiaca TaxID=1783274 RepID=A0A433XAX9_9HYPH|nr:hypothetical protein [Arsenicitalea aurantiaca]RUT31247.1 hypothetical protein EMQ25_10320 [Arsenicitalea aurantiaca]